MGDSEIFKERGLQFAHQAITADNAKEYAKAKNLYLKAVEYLMQFMRSRPQMKPYMMPRLQGYMDRAERLSKLLQEESASAAAASTKKPKSSPKLVEPVLEVDIDEELAKLVGLTDVKQQIRDMQREMLLDNRRLELGLEIEQPMAPHMAFYGNPGTGKTRVARLIGQVFRTLGVVKHGQLVEVQRSDLVAGYVGQTATQTRAVIESAKGGILFVDEAYRLLQSAGQKKDFGQEAIEELMSVMNDGDPVIVFAGYKADMDRFISSNAGLFRRVNIHVTFPDYEPKEIAKIALLVTKSKGFKLNAKVAEKLAALIAAHTSVRQRAAFNGALATRLFNLAKRNLDRRLTLSASREELVTFSEADIVGGLKAIPEPPAGSVVPMSHPPKDDPSSKDKKPATNSTATKNNASASPETDDDATELTIPLCV